MRSISDNRHHDDKSGYTGLLIARLLWYKCHKSLFLYIIILKGEVK